MKQRILIVEDEVALRLAIRWQLKSLEKTLGVEIDPIESRSPSKAFDVLEQGEPLQAAIIDLRLVSSQGVDHDAGFAVIERLAEQTPPVPVVVLSARNDFEALAATKKSTNVRFYITKPWNSKDLQRAVSDCLSGQAKGLIKIGDFEGEHS